MALANRSLKPYPPVDVALVDTSNATGPTGQVAITWKNRNRLTSGIKKQTAATEALEASQTHTIRIYKTAGLVLLRTYSALTGTSQNYTAAQELADTGLLVLSPLTIKIKSIRDTYESAEQTFVITR